MSSNELLSRKSKYSDKQYENSSVCNRSVKSEFNNLSIDLPKQRSKYTTIEKEIISKQQNHQHFIINLTNTKYPILQEVCGAQNLNWKIQNFGETKNWNIKWCDTGVTNQVLQKMSFLQRINHFPSMSILARKNTLAITLTRIKEQFPQDYDYFPRTFLYPNDNAKIMHYYVESRKRGLVKTFIVKPEAGCQGKGIYMTQNPADFQKQQRCVVQKYISNPLLYKGLKFDLRIYVLISCIHPLRIYLYNEGLVRFSTEKYELPNQSNLDNYYMHLTNYAINKSNPNYEYNYSINNMSHGHKKSLAQFFKILKEMGYRANSFWSQIKDNIIKTVIAAQPTILSSYKSCRPQQPTHNMCFQVLGFDFMIDNQNRCYLLEVNHTPSFATDTPLDHIIKKNLIKDTLEMMSISQQEAKVREELERLKQREKYIKFKHGNQDNTVQKQNLVKILEGIRSNQQEMHKGTYQLIYPSKNQSKSQKYQKILSFIDKGQGNYSVSQPRMMSTVDVKTKQKDAPKSKMLSKKSLTKIVNQKSESYSKKNIIYSYNYLKNSLPPNKKVLHTLPAEYKISKQKNISGKSSRAYSKQRLNTQMNNGPEMHTIHQTSNVNYVLPHRSEDKRSVFENRTRGLTVTHQPQQKSKSNRQLSNISKRIRAFKTPLMF